MMEIKSTPDSNSCLEFFRQMNEETTQDDEKVMA